MQQSSSETWVQINLSAQGSLLEHTQCSPGLAQVGELICVNDQNDPSAAKAQVGIVRWVQQSREIEIRLGIELLAKGSVTGSHHPRL